MRYKIIALKVKVIVAIPTVDSAGYLEVTLERLLPEILSVPWVNTELMIGINGMKDSSAVEAVVNQFHLNHPELPVSVMVRKPSGKNDMVNEMVTTAKQTSTSTQDVIHFFDDDVQLKAGSFRENMTALRQHEDPVLVGSHFFVIPKTFSELYKDNKGHIWPTMKALFWTRLFSLPFRVDGDRPKFCSGWSFAARLNTFPVVPPSSTGVADDAYLDCYYALLGKESDHGGIIKPALSVAYSGVPHNMKEWFNQQVRTGVGVRRAFACFGSDQDYIENQFQWPYNFTVASRSAPIDKSLSHRVLYAAFRYFQNKVFTEIDRLEATKQSVLWGRSESSKNV